jgi:hypothetical protein
MKLRRFGCGLQAPNAAWHLRGVVLLHRAGAVLPRTAPFAQNFLQTNLSQNESTVWNFRRDKPPVFNNFEKSQKY